MTHITHRHIYTYLHTRICATCLGGEGHVLEVGAGKEAVVRLPHVLFDWLWAFVCCYDGGVSVILILRLVMVGLKCLLGMTAPACSYTRTPNLSFTHIVDFSPVG